MGRLIAGIGIGAVVLSALIFREFSSWVEDVYCEDYGNGDEDEREGGERK